MPLDFSENHRQRTSQHPRSASSEGDPPFVNMVSAITRRLPRGRGAFPRLIGNLFPDYLKTCHITTRYGAKLAIAPSSLDLIATTINWGRSWEHWVYDTCRWIMPPEGVFYDIGANVGYFAIELMHQLPTTHGVLFEPQPQLVEALNRSKDLNEFHDRCRILECAVSNSTGSAYLNRFNHDGHASISRQSKEKEQIKVDIMTLDDAVKNYSLPLPDVIKIDVEGHESNVLQGGLKTLEAARPNIIFECSALAPFQEISTILRQVGDWRFFYALGSYRPLRQIPQNETLQGKTDILAVETNRSIQLPQEFHPYFSL